MAKKKKSAGGNGKSKASLDLSRRVVVTNKKMSDSSFSTHLYWKKGVLSIDEGEVDGSRVFRIVLDTSIRWKVRCAGSCNWKSRKIFLNQGEASKYGEEEHTSKTNDRHVVETYGEQYQIR